MKLTDLFRISGEVAGEFELQGWVRSIRVSKNVGFIEFNDGSCFKNIQIVFDGNLPNYNEISKTNVGAALNIRGKVVFTPEARQPFEISATAIEVLGESSPQYPLQKKKHSLEYLRTIAHLRPRTNTFSAVFRLRSRAAYAIHNYFNERGFVYIHTPVISSNDGEGAGALFNVTTFDLEQAVGKKLDYSDDYFGCRTNLCVTGQLEAEALAMAFRNVYTFGPTFRAENSNTPRHASEFWMIEPEMAFADINENMRVSEEMLKYLINDVMKNLPDEFDFFNERIDTTLHDKLNNVVSSEFGRITYTDAINELLKAGDRFEYPVKWGIDLQTEHERFITEEIFNKPVFVTDYPKDFKAFYMRQNDDGKTVAAMDLLVPYVGELIGGSQREERLEKLESRMDELGMNKEDLWWYFDLRRYGGNVHSGFGLGFERAIMYLSGIQNIRDAAIFPRTVGNAGF